MARRTPTITTRRALFNFLEEQMDRSYRQILSERRLEKESTQLKTFLLEFDFPKGEITEAEDVFLAQALTLPAQRARPAITPEVSTTAEEGFYLVEWDYKRNRLQLYLDTISDPERRFWLAYSLSTAKELDEVINRLATTQPAFDRVWLWPGLLRETQGRGEFRGFGLDYDYRQFEEQEGKLNSTNYFKGQFWGGPETEQVLSFLCEKEAFRHRTVVAKVRLKYWDDLEQQERFALEDIKYNGKFTTRGPSFNAHQSLVTLVRHVYAETVRRIEKAHTINATATPEPEAGGIAIEGDPLFFNLSETPIGDLDAFCRVVFSGTLPFRLWGVPQSIPGNDQGRMVSAVDLHTGSKLFFEIYPDLISMYLYPGACGNTVIRFFTNLQLTFSRLVRGEDQDGNVIL